MKPTAGRCRELASLLSSGPGPFATGADLDEASAILRNVARAIETLQQPQDIYERAYYPAILSILTGETP